MSKKKFSKKVFKLELTDKQIKKIFKQTGINLKKLKRLKLSAKDIARLLAAHDADKHDQSVGASV